MIQNPDLMLLLAKERQRELQETMRQSRASRPGRAFHRVVFAVLDRRPGQRTRRAFQEHFGVR
jgi:hypothetical protein